jgi:hypothetical protein
VAEHPVEFRPRRSQQLCDCSGSFADNLEDVPFPPAEIRSHTSARWTGMLASTSKPNLTFPPLIPSTVTFSKQAKPSPPPITTDSWLFLDNTNIVEPPFS